jgi:hypothetical protein
LTAGNTSPSWQEPELLDVEVADVAQDPAPLARDGERRQRVQHHLSRRLPQLKPETIFLRRPARLPATTIRNCWFTLFRIDDAPNETGNAT